MKVLFLTNVPSPYRVDFFNELGKYCDLTVIFERDSASDRNKEWISQEKRNFKEIFLNGLKISNDNSISFKIIKYLNRKFDHIIIGMYSTYTAMIAIKYLKIKKIPFIISTDGGFIKKENKIKRKIKTKIISAAKAWLTTGKETTKYLIYYGAKEERCYQYPFTSIKKNWILEKKFSKEQKSKIKKKLGFKEKKLLLFVGRFIHGKGIDTLLKITSELDNDTGMVIIGGNLSEEEKKRKDMSHVYCFDFMKKEELKEYYDAADIFIFPTREDIWGLVVNEALARGLPVVTTIKCISGLELIKNYNNGFIVEDYEEPNKYIQPINYFLETDHQIECIETIKGYSIEEMALIIIKILGEI